MFGAAPFVASVPAVPGGGLPLSLSTRVLFSRPMAADPADSSFLTARQLRQMGSDYLWRANMAMEHARRGKEGGAGYVPLPETPAEHAGQYVLSEGSLKGALAALEYQLRHLDPGENGDLWREAREILVAAIAHAPDHHAGHHG